MRICPQAHNSTGVLWHSPAIRSPLFPNPTPHTAPLFRSDFFRSMSIQCLNCGESFEATRRTQVYCCSRCRRLRQKRLWRRRNHARNKYESTGLMPGWKRCSRCSLQFKFEQPGQRYCSRECGGYNGLLPKSPIG